MIRTRHLISGITIAAVLLITSCSTSTDKASDSTTTSKASVTTTAKTSSSSSTSAAPSKKATTKLTGDFCEMSRQFQKDSEGMMPDGDDQASYLASMQDYYDMSINQLDQLLDAAPTSIKSDVKAVRDFQSDANDRIQKLTVETMDSIDGDEFEMDSPELKASSDKVQAYMTSECGIDSAEG